uniref:Uncharacterized protein n=1 Tax=Salarias fasciatus TaxID=181472 RepID=A0A672HSM7_SALFA
MIKKKAVGIHVIHQENGPGHHDDIGSSADGSIILDHTGSAGRPELRRHHQFIQKVLMGMDGEKLSPKVLGLKNKISVGL